MEADISSKIVLNHLNLSYELHSPYRKYLLSTNNNNVIFHNIDTKFQTYLIYELYCKQQLHREININKLLYNIFASHITFKR